MNISWQSAIACMLYSKTTTVNPPSVCNGTHPVTWVRSQVVGRVDAVSTHARPLNKRTVYRISWA